MNCRGALQGAPCCLGVYVQDLTGIVIGQVAVMFLLLAVGFVLYRVRFINDAGTKQMSDLVLYVANPILIAEALMRPFDAQILVGAIWVAGLMVLFVLLSIGLAVLCYRDRAAAHAAVGRFAVTFTNAGFIGIPLAQAIVGADGVFYISVANTVLTLALWTYGIWLASDDASNIAPIKVVKNPTIIAMVFGLLCFVASWEPPALINQALNTLGDLNTGLVMLVLGAYLGQCDLAATLRSPAIYKACALRLVAMPLLALAVVAGVAHVCAVPYSAAITLVLCEGMPTAAVASLFAHQFGRDGDFASGVVAVSTLLSMATLPVLMGLCSVLL